MDRFVWLDFEHVANLDAIAYFKIEGEQLVNVVFHGAGEYHQIQVKGEYASNLNRLLRQAKDLEPIDYSSRVMKPRGPTG